MRLMAGGMGSDVEGMGHAVCDKGIFPICVPGEVPLMMG
jgi:hypothetical protein